MYFWLPLFIAASVLQQALVDAQPQIITRLDIPAHGLGEKRELGGLLGFDEPTTSAEALHHTEQASTTNREHEHTSTATTAQSTQTSSSTHAGEKQSYSIIGTPPPTLPPPSPGTRTADPSHSTTDYEPTATLRPGAAAESAPPGAGTDWRVIGVAVIAVSVIGTVILAVVFFDQWWRFVRDVCGGRRRKKTHGAEEMIPDWEKGSWEYKADVEGEGFPAPARGDGEGVRGQGLARYSGEAGVPPHLEVPPRTLMRANSYSNPFEGHGAAYAHRASYVSPATAYEPGTPAHDHRSPISGGGGRVHRSNTGRSVAEEDAHAHNRYRSAVAGEPHLHRSNTTRSASARSTPAEDAYDGVVQDP